MILDDVRRGSPGSCHQPGDKRSCGFAVLRAHDLEQKAPSSSVKSAGLSLRPPLLPHGHGQAAGGTQPIGAGQVHSSGVGCGGVDRGWEFGPSCFALGAALNHLSTSSVTLGVTLLPHGLRHAAG